MKQYKCIFPEKYVDAGLFYNVYGQVCTRCFGHGLPSTAMIPMGDNFNHSCVGVTYEVVSIQRHLLEPETYNTDGYDLSLLAKVKGLECRNDEAAAELTGSGAQLATIPAITQQQFTLKTTRRHLQQQSGMAHIWHEPYVHLSSHDEDNDSSSDDNST